MGFIRFYALVFREAFRHSLDLAQAILFVVLGFSGFVVSRNPDLKMTVEGLDLAGWKMAALVFGGIVAIRVVLAPYWLWKAAQARIVSAPEATIDFQFRVQSARNLNDKKRKAVQVGLVLHNSLSVPVQYEVEEMNVTIEGIGNDNPGYKNMGGIVSPNTPTTFDYDWIFLKKWIQPGSKGIASITYRYGIAGRPFARRAKYVADLTFEKSFLRSKPIEDSEENI